MNYRKQVSELSSKYKPVDLAQGCPDFAAPEHLTRALAEAAVSSKNPLLNQYTRGLGHLRLVKAISEIYGKLLGRKIDAEKEVLVTIGGTHALFCAIMSLVDPGDEVILIEPFFDVYMPMTLMAGGVPVFVSLKRSDKTEGESSHSSSEWILDEEELRSKFNHKTKMIILNTPHNPVGKIFTRKELTVISNLCKEFNVVIVSDEVYEFIVYPGNEHIRISSLEGMWDRVITIGSAGKAFCVTGWKLGWAYGSTEIIQGMVTILQNSAYCCPTPIQEAVAVAFETELERLGREDCYWSQLSNTLREKRDRLSKILMESGMNPTIPDAGYFMMSDTSRILKRIHLNDEEAKDYQVMKWLSKEKRLQGIPPSAFYSKEHKDQASNLIRFSFIKKDETIDAAEKVIKSLGSSLDSIY